MFKFVGGNDSGYSVYLLNENGLPQACLGLIRKTPQGWDAIRMTKPEAGSCTSGYASGGLHLTRKAAAEALLKASAC